MAMRKMYPLAIILSIFSLFSCTRQYKIGKIIPGKTDIKTAINYLNTPLESKQSSFDQNSTFYNWKDISLIVKNDIVNSIHRNPANHEVYLQFWRQHYKEFGSEFKKTNTNSLWQLVIPDKNISIIYDENSDRVTKVIYYADK